MRSVERTAQFRRDFRRVKRGARRSAGPMRAGACPHRFPRAARAVNPWTASPFPCRGDALRARALVLSHRAPAEPGLGPSGFDPYRGRPASLTPVSRPPCCTRSRRAAAGVSTPFRNARASGMRTRVGTPCRRRSHRRRSTAVRRRARQGPDTGARGPTRRSHGAADRRPMMSAPGNTMHSNAAAVGERGAEEVGRARARRAADAEHPPLSFTMSVRA